MVALVMTLPHMEPEDYAVLRVTIRLSESSDDRGAHPCLDYKLAAATVHLTHSG